MSDNQSRTPQDTTAAPRPAGHWDYSNMRTSYANVVNASSTREEVTLFFGTNLTWNPAEAKEFNIRLNDRIVLSPFAAKRLWVLMGAVLREHESRFGALNIDAVAPDAQARRDKFEGD